MKVVGMLVGGHYKITCRMIVGRDGGQMFATRRVLGTIEDTGTVTFIATPPETHRQCSAEHFAETALRDVTEEIK